MKMKKLFLITLLAFITVFANAQTVQKTYHFGTPMVSEVNGYDVIRFADTYDKGVTGEATLPWQMVSLLLPQNTDAQSITIEYSDFVELEGTFNLLPRQAARPLSSTKPMVFEKNEDFYRSENVYPETTFSKVNTQYLNGCSFAFANFTPVRYVPATGKVSYAKSVTVTIDVTASRSDRSGKLWLTPEVQGRVERLAQNPEAVQEYKNRARTISGYELLVITPQNWVSHFDEYVAFYEARGLRTHVTALEDILANFDGRDDAEKMRTYITQEYENEGIMMVLLGGDSGLVPWRALYCNVYDDEVDNLPADMYFVCLDGTWNDNNNDLWGEVGEWDLEPELGIGRMPFNNEEQFNNMMHKTLEYQTNPVLGEFRTVILGAEHLGDGYYGSNDLNLLIGGSSEFGYTTVGIPSEYNFVKYYATPSFAWSGGAFRKVINDNGGQYIHHVGHANTGTVAGWEVANINDNSFAKLDGVNHNYNFFHSHGCICGDFTHGCILERMVNISTGFVAVTGNSRYGWYQPWGDGMAAHLHREFIDAYYNDRLPYIGTAFVEMKIMTAPYAIDDPCMRWNLYDINILGDVAVCPWLDEPFRPEVSYASALTMGTTTTPITIMKDGEPQSNFRCSIFHDGELLAFGMTNAYGEANVQFEEPLDIVDNLQLIITGPNALPQTINIVGISNNTAFVYPQSTDIHGDMITGGSFSMDVDLKNVGDINVDNITATLSTTSEFVTLTASTVDAGAINAGDNLLLQNAFAFDIADNIPDYTYVDFVISCTDGTNAWNRDVFYVAKAPSLQINNIEYEEVNGNNNGYIDAGETVRISVAGKNIGHYLANDPYIHVNINTDYVTIAENDIHLNNVNANSDFLKNINITVDENTPDGTIVTLDIDVISGNYNASESLIIVVGTVKEDFETGDFSHMSWAQEGDAEWTVTNEESHNGTYSAQAGFISANQTATMVVYVDCITDGVLSFYYKTKTKYKVDGLAFYVDNKYIKYWSGNKDWKLFEYNLTAGSHRLEWSYITGDNGHQDNSVCWVDDILFPGNTLIVTDVDEVDINHNVTVYPNPTSDFIYVKGDDIQYVEIYNSVGQRVASRSINDSESINIAGFASGIYIARIVDREGNVATTKIVKR